MAVVETGQATFSSLALDLPVPLHVISVGLVVQKRWLPTGWVRTVWIATVVSGCWLGISLLIRWLVLR